MENKCHGLTNDSKCLAALKWHLIREAIILLDCRFFVHDDMTAVAWRNCESFSYVHCTYICKMTSRACRLLMGIFQAATLLPDPLFILPTIAQAKGKITTRKKD